MSTAVVTEDILIVCKAVPFQSEGRLLQELGERLVASPEVAVVELIKNAFDADSPVCEVRYNEDGKSIIIRDEGLGMTSADFEGKWMRIATDSKNRARLSSLYNRKLTGEKGIGRFAVRYLGHYLTLDSVAFDEKRNAKTRLKASFDWVEIDKKADLSDAEISYTLHRVPDDTPTGTNLVISQLRNFSYEVFGRSVRNKILQIVTPISGIDSGRFRRLDQKAGKDPGFRVILPRIATTEDDSVNNIENLASDVLANYWARLTIDLNGEKLRIKVEFPSAVSATKKIDREGFKHNIAGGLFADIRYFPRRGGIFSSKSFDGRLAWTWIRDNSGVGIVDHGLRIRPYGFDKDDWLVQDQDSASNRRNWRSKLMLEDYPIPPDKKVEGRNPMLFLPQARQLVGAVFVESNSEASRKKDESLIPAMDREGFLSNGAFETLWQVVRAGIELLAHADKENEERILREEAEAIAREAKKDFRAVINYIDRSSTLTAEDKARFIKQYDFLAKRFDEAETYGRKVIASVEAMSLIGVVAGFMTHESARIVSALERLMMELGPLEEKFPQLSKVIRTIRESHTEFSNHLEYTSSFIDAIQDGLSASVFAVKPQLELIREKFGRFARSRKIKVSIDVDDSVESPPISVAVYSGIVLNLYTNAIKAVVAGKQQPNHGPEIIFKAWNEGAFHILEVIDNGIGIPERLRERIWDPLFTTTSRDNNPLGSGMGLGLSLVRKLVTDMGGRISLDEAPPSYSTCFKMMLKLKPKFPYAEEK